MSKEVVIYKSKYGATKKYAQWISDELKSDIFEVKMVSTNSLKEYDTIIFGGGLYAGGVNGLSFITKNYELIKNKNIIVFTCGLADPFVDENVKSICKGLDKVFSSEMKSKIKVFHLRGGMDYGELGLSHKLMMSMVHKMVAKKDKESLSDEDKNMLETYGESVDFTDKGTIAPIISLIKEINNGNA